MIFLFTSGVLTDGNLGKILKMSPKVRLSIIGSHCVCWLPNVRGNCGLCNCEFFADDGRTLGNMSRIKTPMYCLAKP